MCSISDHVAEGILKYTLIPYAKMNNIEVGDLISELVKCHNKTEGKSKIQIYNRDDPSPPIKQEAKRGRGRPKGSGKKRLLVLEFNED